MSRPRDPKAVAQVKVGAATGVIRTAATLKEEFAWELAQCSLTVKSLGIKSKSKGTWNQHRVKATGR